MVKIVWSSIILLLSTFVDARILDNTQLYTVPPNEMWVITDIQRLSCNVCTSDIYIQSGNVKINGVWVSGSFNFSMIEQVQVLLEGNTVFALGDVVESVEVRVDE